MLKGEFKHAVLENGGKGINFAGNSREDVGMCDMEKISVVINTYNAERYLREVLESLKGFDEVVVCDMESTDRTLDIAREYGCKIVTFPKGEHKICEPARDFAIHSASNDWVLVVDADELVPDALREYLYERINNGFEGALAVPRKNKFIGLPAHGTPDYQLRFFRQSRATWPAVIHARPETEKPVENIPTKDERYYLVHLDDATLSRRYDKMNRYSDYEVPKRAHRHFGAMQLLFRPIWFFFRNLVIGGAWKDGRRGILNAYAGMMYQLMLMSKVTEEEIRKNERKR